MTDEDLQRVEEWLASEKAGNRWQEQRNQPAYTGLAVEHVEALLAEVRRLREEADQAGHWGLVDADAQEGE